MMAIRFRAKCFPALILFAGILSSCVPTRQENMRQSLDRAETYLFSMQRDDGAIADPGNPLFDTWETVLACQALTFSKSDSGGEALAKALVYLKTQQNPEGLICHNQKCRHQYCLETSSAYAILQASLSPPVLDTQLTGAIWRKRDAGGFWEIGNPDVNEQKAFPSVTGFCVWALPLDQRYQDSLSPSIDWMMACQSKSGSWGASWEYYGTESYALWAIGGALAKSSHGKKTLALMHAFARENQLPEGSWQLAMPGLMKPPSKELQTALMLNFLLDTRPNPHSATDKGMDWLVAQQQPDGKWDGGFFPIPNKRYEKREDLFTTALAMMAIAKYLEEIAPRP